MRSDSRPLVTVIVPVYKVEEFLSRCVESVISQSYHDLEIILVDDGSPDRCGEICDCYRGKDERIIVIHKENGGLSSARNAGIRVARGKYLCFVDSDDYIQSELIEQLLAAIARTGASISACGFASDENLLQNGITEEIRLFPAAEAIREILKDGAICTSAWGKLYERSLFDDILFPEGKYYEDYATTYKLFHKGGRIAYALTKKYYYTINTAGITRSPFSSRNMDYFAISEEVEAFIDDNYPELSSLVKNRSVSVAISLYRKLSHTPGRGQYRVEGEKLTDIIRKNLPGFLLSSYPVLKKTVGLFISLFPEISLKLLNYTFPR